VKAAREGRQETEVYAEVAMEAEVGARAMLVDSVQAKTAVVSGFSFTHLRG
jgi:hypothetical protein